MKTSEFQQYLGGTTVCMNILMMDKKGCVQMKSNDIYFSGIWFSGVKTDEGGVGEGL